MNKDTLRARTGGLSQTAKMPGPSWSISPNECRTGSKMARVPGTICAKCYARKGNYRFPSTVNAHSIRLAAYRKAPGGWADAMIELIEPHKWFRWFDAGDLQGVGMLRQIVRIAKHTPGTFHWLPTREVAPLRWWIQDGGIRPPNLVIRVCGTRPDGKPPRVNLGVNRAAVHATPADLAPGAYACPASTTSGRCDTCRACWDPAVDVVSYPLK